MTGDKGLDVYEKIPGKRLKRGFIEVFKRNPKAILGITKTHFVIHFIKILDKYRLVSLIIPFVTVSLILNLLPAYVMWTVLISSSGYFTYLIIRRRRFKKSKQRKEVNDLC
jgi:hypothetical protein